MKSIRPLGALVASALCSAFACHTASAAELLDRAVLNAHSFAPGPTSGQYASGANGVVLPLIDKQPVQGFSAVLRGPVAGTYLVMCDNGFGAKGNSPDALLRVYALKPDFETGQVHPVNRFTGDVLNDFTPDSYITLRDPWKKVPFAIVADGTNYPGTPTGGGAPIPVDGSIRANRLLTGADFDIESFRRAADGTLWFGDEFGPYLLHTDGQGRVLEAPIPLPNFRNLPSAPGGTEINPLIQAVSNPVRTLAANLPDSGGFEGMALNASGNKLYALLEKAVIGDPNRTRLLISEFSLNQKRYTGRTFSYVIDAPANSIGDMTALTDREFVIIERDQGQGDAADPRQTNPARLKKLFRIDLDDVDANGNLVKEEVADLMNIYDPRDVAADGRTNTVFTFPFVTIEDVLVLDNHRLLVINDNNYPGSAGRSFGVSDNDEFVVLNVAPLLDCDGDDRGHGKRGKHAGWQDKDGRENCRPAKD
ncbi:MAG TPA: esterase-like activity of phytase family protein [Steroidobacteraceae bacterium]|nr:esterase-like activity of phytase family protein [Steroidobacteraceae bacterium]